MGKQIYIENEVYPGYANDLKRGINRRDLFFYKTLKVPLEEYETVKFSIKKIIKETDWDIQIHNFGYYNNGSNFSSPDWYQEQALTNRDKGFGKQTSAVVIDRLLRQEPFQKQYPHFVVLIIDKDLRESIDRPENNFLFGFGPYPNSIVSVRRFIAMKDKKFGRECLAIMSAHEFGHNLELVLRNFNVGREGYKVKHCNGEQGPCLMGQVNIGNARTIQEQTKLLIDREYWLCPSCREETYLRKNELEKRYSESGKF